ncbi:MAG: tol-pal system protein YbgF [Acidobacteria bacterium]|uniref:Tol-pal system protein YbgF n=1 Tax=Candidatus Sulfomarinibacter kjeldsenii TaxID=2885994 RepID=A0A8J6Y1G7_9BACT|nr:tol-pal system protein YbgF [Candidatus Sulfomarinibacter kjeldsenii]MBD3871271.1 tol-pal system protein YbgF [Candidatus Sulfomarinibacter kjeldsenii]
MRPFFSIVASLILLAPLAACTSSEDTALLHREITDVQRSVDRLQTEVIDQSDLQGMEQSMQDMTNKNLRSNADLALRVEELQEQIEALHASLEVTIRRLQTISQELAAVRAQGSAGMVLPPVTTAPGTEGSGATGSNPRAVPVGAAAAGGSNSPDELYRSAYEDYMRGNYDLAAEGFGEYIRRWPNTELTDNALYWIGECYDAQEKPEEALTTFTKVLEDYPTSDKAAAAQLKKGLIYLKMGDQGQGVVNLQYVVYEHPGTREADLAREQLRSLGLTIR